MIKRSVLLLLLLTSFIPRLMAGQEILNLAADSLKKDSIALPTSPDTLNLKRLKPVVISLAALYSVSISSLNELWYKNYPKSSFHFFNDNNEWLQMDKAGHFTTCYYLGKLSYNALRWSGLSENKSVWYGGGLGLLYLTTIEVMDGLSAEWGFSPGDMTANTLGATLFVGQQLAWKDQRIQLKWSYHQTKYAAFRPDLMGKNLNQQWLKDYNGQTYWLSINIKSFLHKESKFPGWLNLDLGYGAEGMTGASVNSWTYQGKNIPPFTRYRQFYLSGDIDLSRIKTRSKTLHFILNTLSFLKIPFPALEFSQGKVITHPLYF